MHSKLRSEISLLSDDHGIESENNNNNENNSKSPLLSNSVTEVYASRPCSAPSSKADKKIIHWKSKNIENDSNSANGVRTTVKGRNAYSAKNSDNRRRVKLPGIRQRVNTRDTSSGSGRPKSGYI